MIFVETVLSQVSHRIFLRKNFQPPIVEFPSREEELERELAMKSSQLVTSQAETASMRLEKEHLGEKRASEIKLLRQKLSSLEEAAENAKSGLQLAQLREDLSTSEREVKRLKERGVFLEQDRTQSEARVRGLEGDLEKKQDKISSLSHERDRIELELGVATRKLSKMELEKDRGEREAEKKVRKLSEELEDGENEREKVLARKVERMEGELVEIVRAGKEQTAEAIRSEKRKFASVEAELENELAEARSKVLKLQRDNAELGLERGLSKGSVEVSEELKDLREKVEELKSRLEARGKRVCDLESENEGLLGEVEKVGRNLRIEKNRNLELQSDLSLESENVADLRKKVSEAQKGLSEKGSPATKGGDNVRLMNEIARLKKRVAELEQELEKAKREASRTEGWEEEKEKIQKNYATLLEQYEKMKKDRLSEPEVQ